jgi:CheY-like chemotaxis protein
MKRPKVLVVDDEPDMCDTFVMVLEPMGYEIFAVVSGEQALAALAERRFDLAITDFMMPGLDGAQTLDAMKLADPGLPVIVVTGFVTEDVFAACNRHGAAAIVKKPFGVKELRELVARLMRP